MSELEERINNELNALKAQTDDEEILKKIENIRELLVGEEKDVKN